MKIVIFGGTGLVGDDLISLLSEKHQVFVVSRSKKNIKNAKCLSYFEDWEKIVDGKDAVINLIGESLAKGRWSEAKKYRMLSSRIFSTLSIVDAISKAKKKPKILINASAIGYYQLNPGKNIDENAPVGHDYMARLCQAWENSANSLKTSRVICLRIGLVLSCKGGALKALLPQYKWFLGGPVASGNQGVSWIHFHDLSRLILYLLENKKISGPINAVTQNPISFKIFSKKIAEKLKRPNLLHKPKQILECLLGKEKSALVTQGNYVVSQKIRKTSFRFFYPTIDSALDQLLLKKASKSSTGEGKK